jgi:hypothetical protein
MTVSTETITSPAAASPGTRWMQLGLGLICMVAISSPQYVWALFTKPRRCCVPSPDIQRKRFGSSRKSRLYSRGDRDGLSRWPKNSQESAGPSAKNRHRIRRRIANAAGTLLRRFGPVAAGRAVLRAHPTGRREPQPRELSASPGSSGGRMNTRAIG